jgi:hypothetical protein
VRSRTRKPSQSVLSRKAQSDGPLRVSNFEKKRRVKCDLRAIPDRTGHNAAHGTARPIAVAVAIMMAMILVIPIIVVAIVVMVVDLMRLMALALVLALAPHLRDVRRTGELWQGRAG